LQPVFDAIVESAVQLCRSERGLCRLTEEIGFRLVAYKRSPAASDVPPPPKLLEHGSFLGRLSASKSPVHIPDLATHHELNSAGEAEREYISKSAVRTTLIVPMLRNDELIGTLGLARLRIEPFTEKEIELVTRALSTSTSLKRRLPLSETERTGYGMTVPLMREQTETASPRSRRPPT
jgi:GAF domain-containing protein